MSQETVTITKEKLNLFVICGKHYVNHNKTKKSILWIHVNELLPLAIKKLKKVEREKELIRMKYCKKTSTKHIELNKHNGYQFTEEDNKKVLDEFDRIEQETVEMACLIVPKGEYPEGDLSFDIRDAFTGIVIPEKEYDLTNPKIKEMLEEENKRVAEEEEEQEES